jgi:antitoxin CptB
VTRRAVSPLGDREEFNRLLWQCRRGMLELDLLLEAFLRSGYRQLDAGQKQRFVELLQVADDDLQRWLLQGAKPPDRWHCLVARLRQVRLG